MKKPPMLKIDIMGADWPAQIAEAVEAGRAVVIEREGQAIARILPEALCRDMERRQKEQDLAIVILDDALARIGEVMQSHRH